MGPLQAQNRGFGGPIGGLNNTKSWNIPTVTYQIKGFSLLMKIKMKKVGFMVLGLTQGPKKGVWAHQGAQFQKVIKHTYCDISN